MVALPTPNNQVPLLAAGEIVLARQFDGYFRRLGAARGEQEVLQRTRRERAQPPGQILCRLIAENVGDAVRQGAGLPTDGLRHARLAVAHERHGDAGDSVNVFLAVLVIDVDALAADERGVFPRGIEREHGSGPGWRLLLHVGLFRG